METKSKSERQKAYMKEYNKRPEVILAKQIAYYQKGPQPKGPRRKPLLADGGPGAVIKVRKERIEKIKAEEKQKEPRNIITIERGSYTIKFD
jgi:hypothetical protein